MGIQHANSELAVQAWLKTVPGLPVNQIGSTLPQDQTTWGSTGFVQYIITGTGLSNRYYGYRVPVVTTHCWAVNLNGQSPPWGIAADLAESIYKELLVEGNGRENLSLSVAGAPKVRVLQAWVLQEPKRIPWGFPAAKGFVDPGNAAHYTIDFQIAWAELP